MARKHVRGTDFFGRHGKDLVSSSCCDCGAQLRVFRARTPHDLCGDCAAHAHLSRPEYGLAQLHLLSDDMFHGEQDYKGEEEQGHSFYEGDV